MKRELLAGLDGIRDAILGVGGAKVRARDSRQLHPNCCVQDECPRTRMEPGSVVDLGVIGLHFRAGQTTQPRLMQLVGDAPDWTVGAIDDVVGIAMALTAVGGAASAPLPIQLAERELKALGPFLEHYSRSVAGELKRRDLESIWLSDWDLTTTQGDTA